jgi:MFS family permease
MVMTMPRAQRIKILIVLGMMSLLTALSGSSTNLAMPKISADLMISSSAATWIVSIGLITTSVLLVMFGHIGDLVSKNLVFLIGEMVFIVGSLLTGIAPTYLTILAGRVIQAVGSAMIMANSMGIVSQYFPDANRAEALAVISMFVSVGSISGPVFGGILITWASWRWIYLFNVPVGLLIVFAGMRLLPLRRPATGEIKQVLGNANWTGQNLFTGGMILTFASGYWLQQPTQHLLGFLILAGGAILTLLAFIQDQRAKSPWIAPALMHNPDYLISVSVLLIVMLVNSVSNILLPFYLQSYGGISAFESGLLMMLQSVVMLMITPFAGWLADHWNRYYLTILGLLVLIVSQVGYAFYPAKLSMAPIIWPIVLNGAGMALFLSPNNALTMGAVDASVSGVAGSLNSLARTIGMTIGISFGATLLFAQLPGVTRISPQSGAPFLHALAFVFWLATIVSVVGLIIVIFRTIRSRRTKASVQ